MKQQGFTLLPTLLGLVLASAVLALLALQLQELARQSAAASRQMRAVTLAENGIEVGRQLLASTKPNTLLKGPDGVLNESTGVRDPLPAFIADRIRPPWQLDPALLNDDGRPDEELLDPYRRQLFGNEYFFLRFSNDPAEESRTDSDGLVLLRSLGVVSSPTGHINHTALIEAKLRREQALLLPSPITATGSLELALSGPVIPIYSGSAATITLIGQSGPPKLTLVAGSGTPVGELGAAVTLTDPVPAPFDRIVRPGFWAHFTSHLPDFTWVDTARQTGVLKLPGGPTGRWEGVAVVDGDVRLSSGFEFVGLLIHIGPGVLELSGATIRGGICLVGPVGEEGPSLRQLSVTSDSRIQWDRPALEQALAQLPAGLVGWRLLYSENSN